MGVFGTTSSPRPSPAPLTTTFTPKGSPQLRPLSADGKGYQFPKYQLPNSRGKTGSKQTSKTATTEIKGPITPSRTTAPLFPDEILSNLYISDLETACAVLSPNYAAPGRPRIKYILSLLESVNDQPKVIELATASDYVLKLIVINDWADTNLIEHLPEARDFIRKSLEANDGGVLVHCRKGVSRSGSVMIAYVMETLSLDCEAALAHVQKIRPKVYPNIGFKNQLKLWQSLNYTLTDPDGKELDAYTEWKLATRLRKNLII